MIAQINSTMCDYREVRYSCSGRSYVVSAWCPKYYEQHKNCLANVVTRCVQGIQMTIADITAAE